MSVFRIYRAIASFIMVADVDKLAQNLVHIKIIYLRLFMIM